jgi:Uma2 family endonuclease
MFFCAHAFAFAILHWPSCGCTVNLDSIVDLRHAETLTKPSTMTLTTHLYTADDLQHLPAERRCELVRGEIRDMPPPGFEHGWVIDNIAFLLGAHVRAKRLGKLFGAETGFRLQSDPDTIRGIDVAFVASSRLIAKPTSGYFPGAPDLAVEVISPSDRLTDVEEKIDDLLRAGSRAVWVVNPMRKTLTVHRAGQQPHVLNATDTITADEVVPGFASLVGAFFE